MVNIMNKTDTKLTLAQKVFQLFTNLGKGYNCFGYYEYPAIISYIFFSEKNISDWHQCLKSLGITIAVYNEHNSKNEVARC